MIKKIPFLFMLVIAFASCESTSVEDETFNAENDKPEIIDIYEDESHGLGN
ncbi:hypothetical protein [uncultured Aquimarina sp.]|uniref:hypothetical protein n=1 Tax=uncultured Aquimarina sp. TaxID=575652 RepID=UPI00261A0D20|nr:hypothetical protein [uncultured Aquimarina sp.]